MQSCLMVIRFEINRTENVILMACLEVLRIYKSLNNKTNPGSRHDHAGRMGPHYAGWSYDTYCSLRFWQLIT